MPDAFSSTGEFTGRCLCGAVTYRFAGPPALSAVCHCTHCQRQTGSLFSLIHGVPRDRFHAEGEMAVFHDHGDSGGAVERHFCPKCGSPIASFVDAVPGLVFVKAGTMDDWAQLPPAVETYRARSASWVPHFEGAATLAGPPPIT